MPYPPDNTVTVVDGQLGLSDTGDTPPICVGCSSSGTAATLYSFNDPALLKSTLGQGPLVESALAARLAAGSVLCLKTAGSTAGAAGAVTKTAVAGGTGTGTITVAGAAYDAYRFIGLITKAGDKGVARFMYSLDGGFTYTEEIVTPSGGTYAVPNTNLTLTFVSGAGPVFYEVGDSHSFTCTAPHYTTSDLSTAWTALLAAIVALDPRRIIFTGKNATGSAAATMAAAISTHMTTLQTNRYFARSVMDAGGDSAANVITAFASFASPRVAIAYGNADVASLNAFPGWGVGRYPLVHVVGERFAGAFLSENLGRVASGALRGVRAITNDEGASAAFAAADKVITARTHRGKNGFYLTNSYLHSAVGSDFRYLEWGMVVDEFCRTGDAVLGNHLLRNLRVLLDGTGKIDPDEAVRIDDEARTELFARIMEQPNAEGRLGHASGIGFALNRATNFLSTQRLSASGRVVPLVPNEGVDLSVGLSRSVAA